MSKDYLVLKFNRSPLVCDINSEQEQMLKWCSKHGFEIQESVIDYSFLVKFERKQNTLDFIKEFLEWKVGHALPFDSLTTMPGIEIMNLSD